uniref:Uncharacterized protein n=1 Tax=Hemiselmis andersenii TaxID=464988 RepID=A0A7S1HLH1_HEMAN|mmetsp:Transcript_652/g.1581  ORF Transcript_652/g.1581 Transcript_652/m.1581 type:complete len:259 (+) Transcript_652:141-917(+)
MFGHTAGGGGMNGMESAVNVKSIRIQATVPRGRAASPVSSPRQMEVSFSRDSPLGMAEWTPFSRKSPSPEREVLETEIFSFASAGKAKKEAVTPRHVPGHRRILPETPAHGRYLSEGPDPLKIGYEGFYMATRSPDCASPEAGGSQGVWEQSGPLTLDWDWQMSPMIKPRSTGGTPGGVQGSVLARQMEAHCTELRGALWSFFQGAGDSDGGGWVEAWSEVSGHTPHPRPSTVPWPCHSSGARAVRLTRNCAAAACPG